MTELTWIPYSGLHHTNEDFRACSSPRPDFVLSPASINRQAQQQKRKRADSSELIAKRQKPDVAKDPLLPSQDLRLPVPMKPQQVAPSLVSPVAQDDGGTNKHHVQAREDATPRSLSQSLTPTTAPSSVTSLIKPPEHDDSQPCARHQHAPNAIHTSDTVSQPVSVMAMQNKVVDRIEAQLNLQILAKHNELRLIETEMGKAQIMLEQLRRCKIIPFPICGSSPAAIDHAISGNGPALAVDPGVLQPRHAPSFGVTDGPYSRHYEKWLIHDEAFETSHPRMSRTSTAAPTPASRKRAALDEATPQRQPKRTSSSAIPQLSTVTITAVDGKSLLVVQREDGEWVKVICRVCAKRDAANLQGFTNHTRIAHSITYSNHKEAIKECGQPLDDHEASQVAAASSAQQPLASLALPAVAPVRLNRPSIPPLALGNQSRHSASANKLLNNMNESHWRTSQPSTPTTASLPNSASTSGFVPSPDTPHLSKKFARLGSNIDLRQLVASSKLRIDLDQVHTLDADSVDETSPPTSATTVSPHTQMPVMGARMPARAPQEGQPAAHARTAPFATRVPTLPGSQLPNGSDLVGGSSAVTFSSSGARRNGETSPNRSPTTNESMPGMVSDHDDDSDYAHGSEHGEEADNRHNESYMHVRVRGEHGYEDADLHYHDIHPDQEHDMTQCAPGASFADPVYYSDTHGQIPGHFRHEFVGSTAPTEKKKRGRPRKSEIPTQVS